MIVAACEHKLRVLIVDDNNDLTTVLQKAFTVCGQSAIVANDARRALDLARRMPLDVIVCDLDMPGMNGFEFVRTLRSTPGMPYHPVCAFTGKSDEDCRRKAAACGFDGYIVKSTRFPDVLHFLQRYQSHAT